MTEDQKYVLACILTICVLLTPVLIGGFLALKFGPRWRRFAERRRMETRMLQMKHDYDVAEEAYDNLKRKGYM